MGSGIGRGVDFGFYVFVLATQNAAYCSMSSSLPLSRRIKKVGEKIESAIPWTKKATEGL